MKSCIFGALALLCLCVVNGNAENSSPHMLIPATRHMSVQRVLADLDYDLADFSAEPKDDSHPEVYVVSCHVKAFPQDGQKNSCTIECQNGDGDIGEAEFQTKVRLHLLFYKDGTLTDKTNCSFVMSFHKGQPTWRSLGRGFPQNYSGNEMAVVVVEEQVEEPREPRKPKLLLFQVMNTGLGDREVKREACQ